MKLFNNVLERRVTSKNYFRKHNAYAFDFSIMQEYESKDWEVLKVVTNTGATYSITRSEFYKSSFLSNEYGKMQYILPVEFLRLEPKRIGVSTMAVDKETHRLIKKLAKNYNVTISEYLRLIIEKEESKLLNS